MGELGSIGWKRFESFLIDHGCRFKRIKGDHRIYAKDGIRRPLVVPMYDPLPPFIILNNLRVLGISKEDFLKSLRP
jgi:predicted RNA binding protein YcfA (HicA-like mRNA interferase family)